MQRLKLSPEKKKAEQDKKRLYMKRCCEVESTHKAARKNNDNASKKRKCQNESTDAAATQKTMPMHQRKENARMKVLMQPQHKKQCQCIKEKKTPE